MLTDFHGRYTERSEANRTVCWEGSGDWLGIGTARGRIYYVYNMQTCSVEVR